MAREPFYLPALADISPKPNILRAGLPVAVGTIVNGVTTAGPAPRWFAAEPLINLGTRGCYHFSDPYCYSDGANPSSNTSVADDLASTTKSASTAGGPMTFANGGFVFTATNATDGSGVAASQGIVFTGTDLFPTAEVADHFVSSIWISFPGSVPANTVNSLLFTYPDGSTWSLVAGVLTFTPVGQAPISIATGNVTGGIVADRPLQLGYSIDAATDGTSQYSVSVYTNGQKVSTTNYATAHTPVTPPLVGFSPNATVATALASYSAMRVYVENTTVSGNDPGVVIATDWLINNNDMLSEILSDTLPEVAAPPAPSPTPTPSPTPAPAPTPAADGSAASFTDAIAANGLQVTFTDTSVPAGGDTITGWSWNFGDGSPANTNQNPVYSYTADGTYLVTLTVTDSASQTATTAQYITVAAQVVAPVTAADGTLADFGMSINGLDVTFTDKSAAGATFTLSTWAWNFGDGGTSAVQNPSHTYAAPGSYVVSLVVGDNNSQSASNSYRVNVV